MLAACAPALQRAGDFGLASKPFNPTTVKQPNRA